MRLEAARSGEAAPKTDRPGHSGVMSGALDPLTHVRPEPHTATASDAGREDLVRRHLPLVGHLLREALSRAPGRVDSEDLRSAGVSALVRAAEVYDAARDGGFTAYASARIRTALLGELRGVDWGAAQPARAESAAPAERAADEPGRDASLGDAVRGLPERLRAVVEGYFFAGRPMDELAAELGVDEREVARLRAEAVRLLGGALAGAIPAPRADRPVRPSFYASLAAHRSAPSGAASWHSGVRRPA
jgi:RNA polymerase sigma factor FliA